MGHRLSRIYTRTGDDGSTGLGDGSRIAKDALRVEAYGTVDELNSALGVVIAETSDSSLNTLMISIQHQLFDLGGELCIPDALMITGEDTDGLEQVLDEINADLPALKEFILPGGGKAAAHCHLARTICRRAERRLVTLAHQDSINPLAVRYLNRLSDLLFVVARKLSQIAAVEEQLWDNKHRHAGPPKTPGSN